MTNRILSTFIFLLLAAPALGFSPIMGNLKINQATCEGESFLWKKHDSIVLSGDFMVLSGTFEKDVPVAGEECRFEDRYLRSEAELSIEKEGKATEATQLIAQKRIVTCFDYSKSTEADVTTQDIEAPLSKATIEMDGRDFKITLEERNLCAGEVVLHLGHNTP